MASRYYRYKNGEEVIVRADLDQNTRYYMRSGYRADEQYTMLSYNQSQRLGKPVHIKNKRGGRYFIEEDYGGYAWTDDMFESPNECCCSSLL